MSPLRRLFNHLREFGTVLIYLKLLLVRHRRTLAYLLLAAATAFAVYGVQNEQSERRASVVQSGRAVAVESCNRDFLNIRILRGILVNAQTAREKAFERGSINSKQLKDFQTFYANELKNLKLPDCRRVSAVLNDNLELDPKIPKPLFPSGSDDGS